MTAYLVPKFLENQRLARVARLRADCVSLAAEKNWKQLEAAGSEWVELDPTAADAWLNLADAYQQQGLFSESIECLLKVPERDPKARQAYLYASELQLGQGGQPSRGIETLARLRRLSPRAAAVRKQLISLYAMTLQRDRMIEEIRDAFKYHAEPPEAYVYLMIADHLSFTNGFQMNTQWLAAESESELFAVARAIQLIDTLKRLEKTTPDTALQLEATESEIASLLQRFPQNRALNHYLIESAIETEDAEKVGELLGRLSETDADSLTWRYRGWHMMMTGKYGDAEQAYRQSISLMPLDWHAWHELANVLRKQARLEEAETAAQIAFTGKELRKDCLSLPDASEANPALLERIYEYAIDCGDTDVAAALAFRR